MSYTSRYTDEESAGWHVAAFIETYCTQTKGRWAGKPLALEDWQREYLDEVFLLDADGRRVYQTTLLGVPRKNGKSTIAAGVGLYLAGADNEPGPEVIIASGSREQAGVVFDQARDYVDSSPFLSDFFDAQRLVIKLRHEKGFIKRVSADGNLQHGLNPNGIVVDELHGFVAPRQEELWSALATATGAREEPLTAVITTAGHDLESILGKLYTGALNSPTAQIERRPGLTIVRDPARGFLMFWFGVENADDLDLSDEASWLELALAANPASWIDADELRRKRNDPTVSEGDFKRLHLNAWTVVKDAWLPSGCWAGLARPNIATPDDAPTWLGVDASLKHDTTGVVRACPVPGGVLLRAHSWAARQDVIAHEYTHSGTIDFTAVEDYIIRQARMLGDAYRATVYDPTFFEASAQRIEREGFAVAAIVQSSATMAAALQEFYQGCREVRVFHDGDPVFASHVDAAAGRMTDRGWRVEKIDKRRSRQRKIDLVIAGVMAHYFAGQTGASSPYESRGLRVI